MKKYRLPAKLVSILLTLLLASFFIFPYWQKQPFLVSQIEAAPAISYLGECGVDGCTYSCNANQHLILKLLGPFRFEIRNCPTTVELTRNSERAWRCTGSGCNLVSGVDFQYDFGAIEKGELVSYYGVDDDYDGRRNRFFLSEDIPKQPKFMTPAEMEQYAFYTIDEGMVFSGSFSIPRATQHLYAYFEDSVGANIIPHAGPTVTPTPKPTATPTPKPTATPTPTPKVTCKAVFSPSPINIKIGETWGDTVAESPLGLLSVTTGEGVPLSIPDSVTGVTYISSSGINLASVGCPASSGKYHCRSVAGNTEGTGSIQAKVNVSVNSSKVTCLAVIPVNIGAAPSEAWFQTGTGDVYARDKIRSVFPDSCVAPDCEPNFCLADELNDPGVVSYGNSYSFGDYAGVSDPGWLSQTNFSRERFSYFYKLLGSPGTDNFSSFYDSSTTIYYSSGDAIINVVKNLLAGQKAIVFANNNVNINADVTVATGGFLAIIARGNIIVDKAVKQLQGAYIANGTIEIKSKGSETEADEEFAGQGTFVANNFILGRDLKADNDTKPAELFTYRPDFWLNVPLKLKTAFFSWQETVPY